MDPLAQLNDIVELEQVSYWPLAWGWWLLISFVLVGACVTSYLIRRRRKASTVLRRQQLAVSQARTVADISHGLKVVVLHYFPNQQLESLTGVAWLVFLNQHLPTNLQYSDNQLQHMAAHFYRANNAQVFSLYHSFACHWLRLVPVLRIAKQLKNGGVHV